MKNALKAKIPDNATIISIYDPESKRNPKEYHSVDFSNIKNPVFKVAVNDINIGVLKEYNLTFETYLPKSNNLAKFIYAAKITV